MEWKIGNVKIKNQVVMAPMAGVSTPAYMKIAEEMGVGLVYTELLSSEAIIRDNSKTYDMLNGIEDIKIPVSFQIFGSNPVTMGQAAKKLYDKYNCQIIDINMGCPVPKVAVRSNSGSALMKDIPLAIEIVKEVIKAVPVPVTVKIRSGWDMNSINACEMAIELEKAGVSAICIHARTRSQAYSGKADWEVIKKVKKTVNIPVIGNGDIRMVEDAEKMLNDTKCDAVMVGRGVLGNPWLIKNILLKINGKEIKEISVEDRIDMCMKHLNLLAKYQEEKVACLEIRNFISWYFKGVKSANELKNRVYQTKNIHDIISLLNEFKEDKLWEK